jgi:hypothetical protein
LHYINFLSVYFDGQGFDRADLLKGFARLLYCLWEKTFLYFSLAYIDKAISVLLFLIWFAPSYLENLIDRT